MTASRPIEPASMPGPYITRNEIIERATSWLWPSVAYSQTNFHTNEYGTYRTDCSGYVSMAWALPGKPVNRYGGLDTIGLTMVSHPIRKCQLRRGDILIRAEGDNLTRHVVIFDQWLGAQAYWGFEQAGGTGTVYRVLTFPYEHTISGYQPARHLALIESG